MSSDASPGADSGTTPAMTPTTVATPQWRERPRNPSLEEDLRSQGISEVLAAVLARRGVASAESLDTRLQSLLPPRLLHNMPEAAEAVAQALHDGQFLLIVGDYDADGATATAVLLRGLGRLAADFGARVAFHVPDRQRMGYGLSPALLEEALATHGQPDWIITVDNGISAHAGVRAARERGIRVLVTDHHLPGDVLPEALIVNPHQPGCGFPSKALAGVGVAFYLVVAVRAEMARRGWMAEPMPRIDDLLPLVALGTVADLVPLDDNNRRLVAQGLARIRSGKAPAGILALFQAAGRDPAQANVGDLGFALGPRLNAAGRLDDISVGIRCLVSDDPAAAANLAQTLQALNEARRDLQEQQAQEAQALASTLQADRPGTLGLVVAHEQFHVGVVGLLASRLKDQFWKPTLVMAPDLEGGLWKASGRSIPGVHLRDVLARVDSQCPGLMVSYGGHAMAAGLSLARESLATFEQAFEAALQELAGRMPEALQGPVLWHDGSLLERSLGLPLGLELQAELAQHVWGQAFPEPRFRDRFRVDKAQWLKEKHLRLSLRPATMGAGPRPAVEAIWFSAAEAMPNGPPDEIDAIYSLEANHWNGQTRLQLRLHAARP